MCVCACAWRARVRGECVRARARVVREARERQTKPCGLAKTLKSLPAHEAKEVGASARARVVARQDGAGLHKNGDAGGCVARLWRGLGGGGGLFGGWGDWSRRFREGNGLVKVLRLISVWRARVGPCCGLQQAGAQRPLNGPAR